MVDGEDLSYLLVPMELADVGTVQDVLTGL